MARRRPSATLGIIVFSAPPPRQRPLVAQRRRPPPFSVLPFPYCTGNHLALGSEGNKAGCATGGHVVTWALRRRNASPSRLRGTFLSIKLPLVIGCFCTREVKPRVRANEAVVYKIAIVSASYLKVNETAVVTTQQQGKCLLLG